MPLSPLSQRTVAAAKSLSAEGQRRLAAARKQSSLDMDEAAQRATNVEPFYLSRPAPVAPLMRSAPQPTPLVMGDPTSPEGDESALDPDLLRKLYAFARPR